MKRDKTLLLPGLLRHYSQAWKDHPRERLKLLLGTAFFPRATSRWLSYLDADTHLQHHARQFPKLVTRIYRPYALRSFNCSQRVTLMIQHHEILRLNGWSNLVDASRNAPLQIAKWTANDGNIVTLQLVSLRDGHREGDHSLQLLWGSEVLFSLTFVLRETQQVRQLLVTRLQGSQNSSAQELIRNATKALHGLRPADFLLQMARNLASKLGCSDVVLVSNRQRVALNPLRRFRIKLDLDKFWLERGASVHSDGLFVMSPEVEIRSDFTDIPSNKRAQARRRSDVLRQAFNALSITLETLRNTGA